MEGTGQGPGSGEGPDNNTRHLQQRWIITYPDASSTEEYIRQLETLGIHLAARDTSGRTRHLLFQDGTVLSGSAEVTRQQLVLSWSDGERVRVDRTLFQALSIDVDPATITHVYSTTLTEAMILAERSFQNLETREIHRTWFVVQPQADGTYQMVVERQTRR